MPGCLGTKFVDETTVDERKRNQKMSRTIEPERLGIVECERIISILEDSTEKLSFLDR